MAIAHRATTEQDRIDAETIWDYHQVGHDLVVCDVAIGLGSHDLGVATYAATLYHDGLVPLLVFTGANSPTTRDRFPRGEAMHYRDHAVELGVPEEAILVEPRATNTGHNITYTRDLLAEHDRTPATVLLISKPYMQRRALATCHKAWPEVDVTCASEPLTFADYLHSIGDEKLVVDMLVGDLQRVVEYPKLGFATQQTVPEHVTDAYDRLLTAGYDSRLLR